MTNKPSALASALIGAQEGDPEFAEYVPDTTTVYSKLSGKHLQNWVNSIGGPKRVSGLIGYSVRQLERFYSEECEIPLAIKVIVRLSDQNMKLRQRGRR